MARPAGGSATTFAGIVYCHAPADARFDLDALARPAETADRWSVEGTLTAYLASSPAVAAAEWARHAGPSDDRSIVALALRPVDVLDIRPGRNATEFLERETARSAAASARQSDACGLLVPSIAFLDRSNEAFNIVLFCDAIPGGLAAVLADARIVGRIRLDGTPPG